MVNYDNRKTQNQETFPVITDFAPTPALPHHPQARVQSQSFQATTHSFQQFLPQSHHFSQQQAQPSDAHQSESETRNNQRYNIPNKKDKSL